MNDSQPNTQDNLLDSLLGDFLDEADQLLTHLNENLLQLDQRVRSPGESQHAPCDAELLNEMFRAAHGLKGLSAMLGLTDINTLTHKIENVFDAARNHALAVNADVVDLVFMGVDRLTALVELLKDPGGEEVDCSAVLEGIHQLLHSAGAERTQGSQADAEKAISDSASQLVPELPDPFDDLRDEGDISEKYVSIFIDETEAALDDLNETLLACEGGRDAQDLHRLLATSHKIKGSAASIGLNRAAKLAHLMEDVLQHAVEADRVLPSEATDALLGCTDALQQYVRQLRKGESESNHFSEAARKLFASESPLPQDPGLVQRPDGVPGANREDMHSAGTAFPYSATAVAPDTLEQPCAGEDSQCTTPGLSRPDRDTAEDKRQSELSSAASAGHTTFVGEVHFEPRLRAAGLKAVLICEKLAKLGDVCYCEPPVESLDELDSLEHLRFWIISNQTAEKIAQHVRVVGVREARIEPLAAQGPAAPCNAGLATRANREDSRVDVPAANETDGAAPAKQAVAETPSRDVRPAVVENAARPTETVRVDIERLDELMNLAGQLVISKAQFSRIGEKLKVALNDKPLEQSLARALRELDKLSGAGGPRADGLHLQAEVQHFRAQASRIQEELETVRKQVRTISQTRNSVKDLLETIHHFDRVSSAVQQAVMDTRMVPIGPLFSRFNRVVRDISRESGKEIRLEIQGEKTELDKRMIDELSDPLIHMVRNSADHGIELPDERARAGKPRQGTVTLDACHRGNSIVIQVSDDGKGLDADRILRKCLEKGILTEADAEKMTPRQIHQMIWVPGMTTAEKVTGVSGRGMGMDIVKSKIEGLNGIVDIETAAGRGTTMTIKLPVTLAILPSLMVDIGGDVFAMPMEAVKEIVSVGQCCLSTVHGQQMATVRGRVITLVRLGDILSFHRARSGAEESQCQETTLVIVGEPGQELGLAVDRVIGEEDIVIKSIAENYKNVPGIAGASILGDGRVSLILDIATLIEMVGKNGATATC